jgi:hypothetical protein
VLVLVVYELPFGTATDEDDENEDDCKVLI